MTQTDTAAPDVVVGRLEEQREGMIVLGVPGRDYRLHLVTAAPLNVPVGERVRGRIHVVAKRVDLFASGGRYIEPVLGRPRWVQGRIIGGDPASNTITVLPILGVPVIATLTDARQSPDQFAPGQLVGFSVERGARFEPIPL